MLRSLTILTILTSTVLLTACQSTTAVTNSSAEYEGFKSGVVENAFQYNQWQWEYHMQRKRGNVR